MNRIDIEPIMPIVKERVEPHLKDLPQHSYSLLWLAMTCYLQGMLDAIENSPRNRVASGPEHGPDGSVPAKEAGKR